jgi:hypothetical protein
VKESRTKDHEREHGRQLLTRRIHWASIAIWRTSADREACPELLLTTSGITDGSPTIPVAHLWSAMPSHIDSRFLITGHTKLNHLQGDRLSC